MLKDCLGVDSTKYCKKKRVVADYMFSVAIEMSMETGLPKNF